MSLLQCAQCGKDISATHKTCPHCGIKISFWREVKSSVEKNRLRQGLLAVLVLFLLGTSWFLGMSTGYRWPLYVVVILCAPVVPWLLQLAYKSAAPVGDEGAEQDKDKTETDLSSQDQKYWRG